MNIFTWVFSLYQHIKAYSLFHCTLYFFFHINNRAFSIMSMIFFVRVFHINMIFFFVFVFFLL